MSLTKVLKSMEDRYCDVRTSVPIKCRIAEPQCDSRTESSGFRTLSTIRPSMLQKDPQSEHGSGHGGKTQIVLDILRCRLTQMDRLGS